MQNTTSKAIYDVAIVGGGPAGACSAYQLAHQGFRVALLERAALPRYKTCGGGLVQRAQRSLPVNVTSAIERPLPSATLSFLKTGLSFEARRAEPLIQMTMRSALDQLLVSKAMAAGANVLTETRVTGLTRSANDVTLQTTRGPLAARFVIGADGVHSVVARAVGWPDQRALRPALEHEIRVPEQDFARFAGTARFDFDIPPHGYAWVFPKREHLSVGVLSVRAHDPGLRDRLRQYLAAVGITRILDEQPHGFLIPLSPRASYLAKDRVLLTGDAAGLADPVTAEGISAAIQSGQMAARALIEGGLQPNAVERLYDRWIDEQVRPELRAGRWLASLLYGWPRLRGGLFRRHGERLTHAMAEILAGERSYRDSLADWRNYGRLASILRRARDCQPGQPGSV